MPDTISDEPDPYPGNVVHVARSVSSDQRHHLVEVAWWESEYGSIGIRHEILVTAHAALELATALTQAADGALRDIVSDIEYGECARCQNLRFIDVVPTHGHGTERVRCPVCVGSAAPVPTIPAWRDTEAEKDPRR